MAIPHADGTCAAPGMEQVFIYVLPFVHLLVVSHRRSAARITPVMHEVDRGRTTARTGVRRIVAMEVVSGIGDGVFWVGLAAVLIDRNSGAQAFTLAALARLGPRALISAPAGVLADRVDRRRLLVGLDLRRALLMIALAVVAVAEGPVVAILLLVLGTYTLAAPYRPALTAALPSVAGESRLASANAMVSTVRQLMTFIGPLFGALVIELSMTALPSCFSAAHQFSNIAAISRSAAAPSGSSGWNASSSNSSRASASSLVVTTATPSAASSCRVEREASAGSANELNSLPADGCSTRGVKPAATCSRAVPTVASASSAAARPMAATSTSTWARRCMIAN